MQKRLRLNWKVLIVCILLLGIPGVKADNSTKEDKAILLTINWIQDTEADRPESITIELYRDVDSEQVPIDSKTLTKADQISENTWQTSFPYLYGEVWEYAFKITSTDPATGLYSYQLVESGNGTDHYTFDFVYGHGTTEMQVIMKWEDQNDEKGLRPNSITVDLVPLSANGQPERSILLQGSSDEDTWSASVTGLELDPSNYYIVLQDLPKNYSNVVTRGDQNNIYVSTNTLDLTVPVEEESSIDQALSSTLPVMTDTLASKLTGFQNGLLRSVWLNIFLLLLLIGVSALAIRKHRQLIRERKKK